MTRHNKKRNTGLLYEFLVRAASEAIIEGDDKNRDVALKIIKRHFARNSELYREFRLFHSLAATTVQSETVADSILEAAKHAAKQYNARNLDHEKSMLIRSINHNLNNNKFYDRRVSEYTIYATIQTLLNEWRRSTPSDIVKVAEYEQTLREWLLQPKSVSTVDDTSDADPLVEKLMLKKFNERYGGNLTAEQADLIRSYVFSDGNMTEQIDKLKETTLNEIGNYLKEHGDSYLTQKLERAQTLILESKIDESDECVEKFLDIAKLKHEIVHKE